MALSECKSTIILFILFSSSYTFLSFFFRITKVQCDCLPNRRTRFHLHPCFVSSYRFDMIIHFELLSLSSLSVFCFWIFYLRLVLRLVGMNFHANVNRPRQCLINCLWSSQNRTATNSAGKRDHHGDIGRNLVIVELPATRQYSHRLFHRRLQLRWAMETSK